MSPVRRTLTAIGLPIGLILLWHLLSVNSTNFFVPKPVQLVQTLGNVWIGPRFIEDVVPSVLRLIVGVVLAITLGIAAGLLIGSGFAGVWVAATVCGTALAALLFLRLGRYLTTEQDGRTGASAPRLDVTAE